MPSSADEVDTALAHAGELIDDAIAALPAGSLPIVLIDGRSGAGKTTVARQLRERSPRTMSLIGLDELYPGWDGLAAGAEMARELILEPIRAGRPGRWRRWDWTRHRPGEEVITPAGVPLILEGAGVLTPAAAALTPVRVWLESPEEHRRDRALARDGETYRPHWRRWAEQEDEHVRANRPRDLATILVDVP